MSSAQKEEKDLRKIDTHDLSIVVKNRVSVVSKDKWNYVLLIFLYVLQGIFKGLIQAVPLILQENGATYAEQAVFEVASLAGWLKILWAPLIECIYFVQLGKRKSWLIPCMYLLGLITLISSFKIDDWLGVEGNKPNILSVCFLFSCCAFILNTIDIVVDSWALTMLRRENVGYQATCDLIGNRLGHFLGYILFTLLKSKGISEYFGQKTAILSFSGYLLFWSVVLLVCNTGILFFKKDRSLEVVENTEKQLGILECYKLIWDVLKLKAVRDLCIVVLLSKVGVGPLISLSGLKMVQNGLKPELLVLLELPLIPIQAALPFILKSCFEGSQGLREYPKMLISMIPVAMLFCALFFYMPDLKENGELTMTFYIAYFFIHGLEYIVQFLMNISFMSFMAKISDPKYGAVYLTVLQTLRALAALWPMFLSLALVDPLTIYKSNCVKEHDKRNCVFVDGFYIEVLFASLFSIFFLRFGGFKEMLRIQSLDENVWQVQDKEIENHCEKEVYYNDVTV